MLLSQQDIYDVPLPTTHRFPMAKYRMTRVGLQEELGDRAVFEESPLVTRNDLILTHDADYVQRFLDNRMTPKENRVIGFPWSDGSVKRSLSSVGGTVAAMHAVCTSPLSKNDDFQLFAGHVAGGTHHAFADRGEGFCVFNDIAVAANVALRDYPSLVRQILIIDLDVHQGNGSAVLFQDKPQVFTFSMQCSTNYFSEKQTSDLDIEVPPGAGDAEYMDILHQHVSCVL